MEPSPNPRSAQPQAPARPSRGYLVQPGWRLMIQDLGLNPDAVLRRAQLPADLLMRHDKHLSAASYFALWRALEIEAALSDGPPVPLRIAQSLSAEWFDPVLFSALCSADLGSALTRIAQYKRLICPMRLTLSQGTGRTRLTLHWPEPVEQVPDVLIAAELVFFVQLARMATRSRIEPLRVQCPSLPQPQQAYEDFWGVRITPGPLPSLVFAEQDMQLPFLTVNPALWSFFEPTLRQRLSELDHNARVSDRLRSALIEALPAGESAMAQLSRRLGLSTRTLQRRLQAEGTSFQRTLDAVRMDLARHYLTQSSMSSGEIAFLLGFEDPSSFMRAFQGWTGQTPQALRQTRPTAPAHPQTLV